MKLKVSIPFIYVILSQLQFVLSAVYIMQMSRKFLTGIILNEFVFFPQCRMSQTLRLRAVFLINKKNVSDGFCLKINQEIFT